MLARTPEAKVDARCRPKLRFGLAQGLIVSLLLHGALAAPFLIAPLLPGERDDGDILVVSLEGAIADEQSEEQALKQEANQTAAEPPPPATAQHQQQMPPQDDAVSAPQPPAPASPQPQEPKPQAAPALQALPGADEEKKAKTLSRDPADEARELKAYLAKVSKKVQSRLIYPAAANRDQLRGAPVVAFTILADGRLKPGATRLARSSGHDLLDAAAVKTLEAASPFAPPPREINVAVSLNYSR